MLTLIGCGHSHQLNAKGAGSGRDIHRRQNEGDNHIRVLLDHEYKRAVRPIKIQVCHTVEEPP